MGDWRNLSRIKVELMEKVNMKTKMKMGRKKKKKQKRRAVWTRIENRQGVCLLALVNAPVLVIVHDRD